MTPSSRRVLAAALLSLSAVGIACSDRFVAPTGPGPGGPTGGGPTPGKVTSVTVTPALDTVIVGASAQLTAAVVADSGLATTVQWRSSDTTIAQVNGSGLVVGRAAGAATVTARATADTLKLGTANVVVRAPAPVPPSASILDVTQGGSPATLSALASVITVDVAVDPKAEALDSVRLVLNNGVRDSLLADSALAGLTTAGTISLTVNTAAYNAGSGAVRFTNGAYTLSAQAFYRRGSQHVVSAPLSVALSNTDFLLGAMSASPDAGQPASALDSAGVAWHEGSILLGVLPVVYSASPIDSVTVSLPGTASLTIKVPGQASFANRAGTAPNVKDMVVAGLVPSVSSVHRSGAVGPAVFQNAAALALNLDNLAPLSPTYTFNTQGGTGSWLGRAFLFSTRSGFGYTAGPASTPPGVGKVTTTFQYGAGASPTTWYTVTQAIAVPPSTMNTAYTLRIKESDALGNLRYTTVPGTFGVDTVPPSISFDPLSAADSAIYSTLRPGTTMSVTYADDASQFTANPVRVTVTRAFPGITPAQACVVGTLDSNNVCQPVFTSSSTYVDGGSGLPGYFTYTASIADQAGNVSPSVPARRVLIDASRPTVDPINRPATYAGYGSVSFTTTLRDDIGLMSGQMLLTYPNLTLAFPVQHYGTPFGNATRAVFFTGTNSPFLENIESTDASGNLQDDRANGTPTTVTVRAFDAAGSTVTSAPLNNAPIGYPAASFASVGLGSFSVVTPTGAVSAAPPGVTPTNPSSIVLTANASGPSGVADPFTAGVFFYAAAAGGTEYQLLGQGVANYVDAGGTRTYSYTLNWTPPIGFLTGRMNLRAIGVNTSGDALTTQPNNNVTVTNP